MNMDLNGRNNLPGGVTPSKAVKRAARAAAPTSAMKTTRQKRSRDDAADAPGPLVKQARRKRTDKASNPPPGAQVIDLTGDTLISATTTPKHQKAEKPPSPERRLRRYREHPPRSYLDRLERVQTQRFVSMRFTCL